LDPIGSAFFSNSSLITEYPDTAASEQSPAFEYNFDTNELKILFDENLALDQMTLKLGLVDELEEVSIYEISLRIVSPETETEKKADNHEGHSGTMDH